MKNIKPVEINFLKEQPSKSDFLYRYVTIDKLLDFLINCRIPLVRLNVFEDKLEGVSIDHLLLNYSSEQMSLNMAKWVGGTFKLIGLNFNPNSRNNLRRQREDFQKNNFASCWYVNNHESVAMWQIYSKADSVAIRLGYDGLKKIIEDKEFLLSGYNHEKLTVGKITYCKFNQISDLQDCAIDYTKGFVKDYCFSHEQEFRLMVKIKSIETKKLQRGGAILDEQVDKINRSNGLQLIYLTFRDFKQIPFEIIFHPQCQEWHKENIKSIIDKYQLPFILKESSLKEMFK